MTKNQDYEEIFSKKVRAGRRTYFFDVKSTKAEDYYLNITESIKDTNDHGKFSYRKHKIFLYKEDFNNFKKAFEEVSNFIFKEKGKKIILNTKSKISEARNPKDVKENLSDNFIEVSFDDLGKD
jgi:hypothetical protein